MIESILINTYNADPALRHESEKALEIILRQHNSLSAFVNFIGDANNHRDLRLAAAIAIKNKARAYWRDDVEVTSDGFHISDIEKDYVKTTIIQVLLHEHDSAIRGLLAEIVKAYAEYDYPEKWPSLLPTLVTAISSQQQDDLLQLFNALTALRKLVKKFEYKTKEKRAPLDHIIQGTFSHLLQIASNIFSRNETSIESAQIVKMILKSFWSSTMYTLPLTAQGLDVNAWFQLLAHVLDTNLDFIDASIVDADQKTLHPWWKTKKWSSRIMCQMIQRYGNPRYSGDEYTVFANYFKNTVANILLAPVMNTLLRKSQGVFVTDIVHRMCLTYTANAIEMSPSYKAVKPHLEFLLFSVIFPTLCISMQDITLFNEDPIEYSRKINDTAEDYLDPRVAAINLLQMLARYRQKDTLPTFMPFLQSTLAAYESSPKTEVTCIKKDGVLVAVGSIQKILQESKTYAAMLEPFLLVHVVPELTSPIGFLRARACWFVEYVDEDMWEKEAVLKVVLGGLLGNLRDAALPVQTAAACSMRLLISQEGAKDLLRPMLPAIVEEYFRIMDEAENDSVISALQTLVTQFGEEIQGIAAMMAQRLAASFYRFIEAQNEDDDDATFAACGCLDTICAVIESIEEVPAALQSIEPSVMPLIISILRNEKELGFEFIDSASQMLGTLTYFQDGISPLLFSACPPLMEAVSDWAFDYIAEIAGPLLNYMSKSTELFLTSYLSNGQLMVTALLQVIERTIADVDGLETDACSASTLLSCLVTSSKGRIDQHLRAIWMLVLNRIQLKIKTKSYKTSLMNVSLALMWYDPVVSVGILNGQSSLAVAFFMMLFESVLKMETPFSRRLIILGFSSVLSLPLEALPSPFATNVEAMFRQVIRELVLVREEAADEENESNGDQNGDDDNDDGFEDDEVHMKKGTSSKWCVALDSLNVPEGGYDEDEDCINAEDETYREAIQKLDKDERVKRQLYIDGEPVDDDDDDDDTSYEFTSPIENFDVLGFFIGSMRSFEARDGHSLLRLQASLDQEDSLRLKELLKAHAERSDSVTQ